MTSPVLPGRHWRGDAMYLAQCGWCERTYALEWEPPGSELQGDSGFTCPRPACQAHLAPPVAVVAGRSYRLRDGFPSGTRYVVLEPPAGGRCKVRLLGVPDAPVLSFPVTELLP